MKKYLLFILILFALFINFLGPINAQEDGEELPPEDVVEPVDPPPPVDTGPIDPPILPPQNPNCMNFDVNLQTDDNWPPAAYAWISCPGRAGVCQGDDENLYPGQTVALRNCNCLLSPDGACIQVNALPAGCTRVDNNSYCGGNGEAPRSATIVVTCEGEEEPIRCADGSLPRDHGICTSTGQCIPQYGCPFTRTCTDDSECVTAPPGECPNGEPKGPITKCVENQCVAATGCPEENDNCTVGQTCVPECPDGGPLRQVGVCEGNQCVQRMGCVDECGNDNSRCAPPAICPNTGNPPQPVPVCVNGQCVVQNACAADQCTPNQPCVPPPVVCPIDGQPPRPIPVCVNDQCVVRNDCPTGQPLCTPGQPCVPPPCPSGQVPNAPVCNPNGQCVQGTQCGVPQCQLGTSCVPPGGPPPPAGGPPPPPQCPAGENFPHFACVGGQCKQVDGCGVNSCNPANDTCAVQPPPPPGVCIPPEVFPRKACVGNRCLPVDECGVNTCENDSQCVIGTPPPPAFNPNACKCDGIEHTAIIPGQITLITAYFKVEGADVNLARVRDVRFVFSAVSGSSPFNQEVTRPVEIVRNTPTLVRYKATWELAIPPNITPNTPFRIQANAGCVPKTVALLNNSGVLGVATQNVASFWDDFINFLRSLFGLGPTQPPAQPPQAPPPPAVTPAQTPLGGQQLQLRPIQPAKITDKKCSAIQFEFENPQ